MGVLSTVRLTNKGCSNPESSLCALLLDSSDNTENSSLCYFESYFTSSFSYLLAKAPTSEIIRKTQSLQVLENNY